MAIVLYKKSASSGGSRSEAECCICLEIFGDKEEVKVLLECRHCFHQSVWTSGLRLSRVARFAVLHSDFSSPPSKIPKLSSLEDFSSPPTNDSPAFFRHESSGFFSTHLKLR
ncbi:hypothetical protein Salat_1879800 [Sesamum alatum]|uniref:RING-type domain-containing protein n=1 Tax=Sesamum alatum TaxID=300844 RepID=A0AAE2CI38_9LAMI|nr:hypothetical protein Salat_1879800 [Sesamum alatum]